MAITFNGVTGPFPDTNFMYRGFDFNYAPNVGDLVIGAVLTKPSVATSNPPVGFSPLGSVVSGTAAMFNGGGSQSLALYSKVNTGETSSAYAYLPDNVVVSPMTYSSSGWSRTAGSGWVVSGAFGADTNLSTTAISVTCTTAPRFITGDSGMLFVGMTHASATMSSVVFSIPGCVVNLNTAAVIAYSTTTSNDAKFYQYRFTITSGTATGPPTLTAVANSTSYSAVPMAVVRIGELSGSELVGATATIGIASAPVRPLPRFLVTVPVTVTTPIVSKGLSNGKPGLVSVTAPAASLALPLVSGVMNASLALTVGTSGVLQGVDPATAASEGSTDPVEVQIWSPDNTRMLAVIERRSDMQWIDDLNSAGSGSFTIHRYDPKATYSNLSLFNLVKFVYAGKARYVSRIENRQLSVAKTNDFAAQEWHVSGRGGMALLSDAILYPEYGINNYTKKDRRFFFGSREGTWYIPSEWVPPQGMPHNHTPMDHPWYGFPPGWPDPAAEWIWSTNPNAISDAQTEWFRSYFTLDRDMWVTIFIAADDYANAFLDGFEIPGTGAPGLNGFRATPAKFTVKLGPGPHLLAIEATNTSDTLEEVQPIVTANEVTPTYATDSNRPYIGKGFTDGGNPYVNSDGSIDGAWPGSAVFDSNPSTYWLSVGNYLGWTSAYEYVEGTFSAQMVTAVRVHVRGGPYTVFVSLKNGGNDWNGDATIPYIYRKVNAGSNIRYVRSVGFAFEQDAVINVPPQMADRVRITLHATWDSGLWQYRWRGCLREVKVTSESREGSFIRGGNYAGVLVSVVETDETGGAMGAFIHRSNTTQWLVKTGDKPGWRPVHIITQLINEAKARNVLGTNTLKLGFTDFVDSNGVPWTSPLLDTSFPVGTDYLSLFKLLSERSAVDIWLDPTTMTLHAAEHRGIDSSLGEAAIILRPGQSLTDFGIDTERPTATRFIVESVLGWSEVGDFETEMTYGRIEHLISLGHELSVPASREAALIELNRLGVETWDSTTTTTGSIGPRPYLEYDIGDYILLPIGFGSELGINRVMSFGVSENDAGSLKIVVELDRVNAIPPRSDDPPAVPPPIEVISPHRPPPVVKKSDPGGASGGSSLSVTMSTAPADGDYLVLFMGGTMTSSTTSTPDPITPPTGWSRIAWSHSTNMGQSRYNAAFARRVTTGATEPLTTAWATAIPSTYSWVLLTVSGVHPTQPLDGSTFQNVHSGSSLQTPYLSRNTPVQIGDHLAIAFVHTVNPSKSDGRPAFQSIWAPLASSIVPTGWQTSSSDNDMLHLFSRPTGQARPVGGTSEDVGTIAGSPIATVTAVVLLRAAP